MDLHNNTAELFTEEKLPESVIIVFNVIAAVTIVVNSFHLYMIFSQPLLSKPAYYNYRLFLISLAILDLALAAVRLLLSNQFFQSLMEQYDIFCTVTAVYLHLTYTSMVSLILMVTVDRAYSLKQSITYQSRSFVKSYPKILALVILVFAAIYTTLGVIFNGKGFSTKDVGTCNFGSFEIPILGAPTVLLMLLCFLVITGIYIYIIALTKLYVARNTNGKENRRITELTKTIGAIIAGNALCWLPPITSSVLWAVGIPSVELEIFALVMLELNSLANPLLYGLANETYRKHVYKITLKVFHLSNSVETTESTATKTVVNNISTISGSTHL